MTAIPAYRPAQFAVPPTAAGGTRCPSPSPIAAAPSRSTATSQGRRPRVHPTTRYAAVQAVTAATADASHGQVTGPPPPSSAATTAAAVVAARRPPATLAGAGRTGQMPAPPAPGLLASRPARPPAPTGAG